MWKGLTYALSVVQKTLRMRAKGDIKLEDVKLYGLTPCNPDVLSAFFCSYYGVREPRLLYYPEIGEGVHGRYHVRAELILYTHPVEEVIKHELAHHIRSLTGGNPVKHDRGFKELLNSMGGN